MYVTLQTHSYTMTEMM